MAKAEKYARRLTHQPLPIEILIKKGRKEIYKARYVPLQILMKIEGSKGKSSVFLELSKTEPIETGRA